MVAILVDDETDPVGEPGGPAFAGDTASVPIVPPGVRETPAPADSPGSILAAWAAAPAKPKRGARPGRARRVITRLLLLAMVGAGCYLAYPRVRTFVRQRSVPAALRSYVGGKGVRYAPAGLGYSVRLPAEPVRRDGVSTSPDRQMTLISRALVSGAGYEIVIRADILPATTTATLSAELAAAFDDPQLAGTAAPVHVHQLEFAGHSAYDYDLDVGNGLPTHARMFLRGRRFFVISVQSKSAPVVFDELMRSLRFPAGLDTVG